MRALNSVHLENIFPSLKRQMGLKISLTVLKPGNYFVCKEGERVKCGKFPVSHSFN